MKITAVILAAGMGNRLLEHTTHKPKALVEVGGRPLLSYALEYVRTIGADEVYVVGGYHYSAVEQFVTVADPDAICIENPEFKLQNLVSFNTVLQSIEEDTNLLVVNVDYIFHKDTLLRMREAKNNFSIYCSYDLSGDTEDVMKVEVDAVSNMVAMSKTLTEFQAIYTGYWFVPYDHMQLLRSTVATLLETVDLKTTPVEVVFKAFIEQGVSIHVADIGPSNWLEVDTPAELAVARDRIKEYLD